MEEKYAFHRRDISWLSFNRRVLMEAGNEEIPLFERIKFMAIYSSNLEEFYQVRVAMHKAVARGGKSEDYTPAESIEILKRLHILIAQQIKEQLHIYNTQLIPALLAHGIKLYHGTEPLATEHTEEISTYFQEEILPTLQPVKIEAQEIAYFLKNKQVYLAIQARRKADGERHFFMLQVPHAELPRFVHLQKKDRFHCFAYIEDVIKANIQILLPGYNVEACHCCRISRDADIFVDDLPTEKMIKELPKKVKKRKIGAVSRFEYEQGMPTSLLHTLMAFFQLKPEEVIASETYLCLEDLAKLPNPTEQSLSDTPMDAIRLRGLDERRRFMFARIAQRDLLMHYPYHSFEHFLRFLHEAVNDPYTDEILITQYRVAAHSEVIESLISAARNGKKVTVFVELKARFDERNNWETAEMMRKAGVNILFSIPGLKVHAKVALVVRRNKAGRMLRSYACISTGNFNETTAGIYADTALFTCRQAIVNDLYRLFLHLKGEMESPKFRHLLITRFNLLEQLRTLLLREIAHAKAGKAAHIILKMNALHDKEMISLLYQASQAGVKIDLIVRGICCLVTEQPYSKNIRVVRIVDRFLEHARIWYFSNAGKPEVYLGSPDWMRRNLYKRIEAVTPVLDEVARKELIELLHLQIAERSKTVWVDQSLENHYFSTPTTQIPAQKAWYEYLKHRKIQTPVSIRHK